MVMFDSNPRAPSSRKLFSSLASTSLGVLIACAAGCTQQTQAPVAAPAATPPVPPISTTPPNTARAGTTAAAAQWQLGATSLTIEVGKSGRLARLGHNHVVHSTEVAGDLLLAADNQLSADIYVPVTSLVVDNPEQRSIYATKKPQTYGTQPTPKQIAGTRTNMLSARVLNAVQHEHLRATMSAVHPTLIADLTDPVTAQEPHAVPITLDLVIAGRKASLDCTLIWRRADDLVLWESEFSVTHDQLGLQPFSALAGALSVAQELAIRLQGEIDVSELAEPSGAEG